MKQLRKDSKNFSYQNYVPWDLVSYANFWRIYRFHWNFDEKSFRTRIELNLSFKKWPFWKASYCLISVRKFQPSFPSFLKNLVQFSRLVSVQFLFRFISVSCQLLNYYLSYISVSSQFLQVHQFSSKLLQLTLSSVCSQFALSLLSVFS